LVGTHHETSAPIVNGTKRALPTEEDTATQSSKKAKLDSQETWYQHRDLLEDGTDVHQYTIYNISATSPIRKKVDMSIHKRTIRITPAATAKDKDGDKAKSQTMVFLLEDLKRSFVLPTHGKQKPHYTMIMLSSDVTSLPKGSTTDSGETHWQICVGSELTLPNLVTRSNDSSEHRHPKGASIGAAFDSFQEFVPHDAKALKPQTKDHANASGATGVDGYKAAKPGTLWFFRQGILWDAKPIEFWAVGDLVSADGGEDGQTLGGVRMFSATGRQCTVILRRRIPKTKEGGGEDGDGEDVAETDFEMIEGKEQDGIAEWCRRYSKTFGKRTASTSRTPTSTPALPSSAKGKGKARATDDDMEVDGEGGATNQVDLANNPMAEDEGDLDDDDFTNSDSELSDGSDSEEGGGSDESAGGSEDGDSDEEGEGEGEESRPEPESEEVEDFDEESFDPKHHPLLRPGAMPKRVSKAVLNAVVGMVEEEFGVTAGGAGGDEEDELDDDEL
jgi:hypothetical protein